MLPEVVRTIEIGDPFALDGRLVEDVEPEPYDVADGFAAAYRHRFEQRFEIFRAPIADAMVPVGAEVRLGLAPKITLAAPPPGGPGDVGFRTLPEAIVIREARAEVRVERSGATATYGIDRALDLRFVRSASCGTNACDYLFDGPVLNVRNALTLALSATDEEFRDFEILSRGDGLTRVVVDVDVVAWSPRPLNDHRLTFRIVSGGTQLVLVN